MSDQPSFPRHSARTQRFTLGAPRSASISPDGDRVVFLRSAGGTDRVTRLRVLDVASGTERVAADPQSLLAAGEEDLSPQERARRERSREGAGGIVGYATDRRVAAAAFALSSRLFVADLAGDDPPRELPAAGPVLDPRPDPTGTRVAYAASGGLHVVDLDGGGGRELVGPEGADVTWGVAEFVAAEEMDRSRGYWWSPEGDRLLVARVDVSPVQRWWIADPEHPGTPPTEVRYPAAGTPNADVRLALVALDGTRVPVEWDRDALPYLADVHWSEGRPPLVTVQSRDQRTVAVLSVDVADGSTSVLREDTDPQWVDLVPGVPVWGPRGLVHTVLDGDTRRVALDGDPLSPPGLEVLGVLDVDDDGVLVSATDEPTERHVVHVGWDGRTERLSEGPGVHSGRRRAGLLLLSSATLDRPGTRVELRRGGAVVGRLESHADVPALEPRVELLRLGSRELRTALLLPTGWTPDDGPLPVLLDPYGGPHAARVLAARSAFLSSQWFADQGFAVVVVDGRGTPARGAAWERSLHLDVAGPVLEDQVDALQELARLRPDALDPSRVGIRGWSFGGYLAALAVLRRPDVVHAAVAGAPATDWALYDTHYTERYLGTPQEQPDAYARTSLVHDAGRLERPLMIVHGLADDNVVVAHSLALSSALLAAGRPHTVLPLSGVTHMTPQEVVAENLLLLQVRFLHDALARPA